MGKASRRNRNQSSCSKAVVAGCGKCTNAVVSLQSLPPTCLHGSTQEAINPHGEYHKALEGYFRVYQKGGTITEEELIESIRAYKRDHERLRIDPGFARFIFTWCTQKHITNCDDKRFVPFLLILGIEIRYICIPSAEGHYVGPGSEYRKKFEKYNRDIYTDRGVVNCLARETPCDCMKSARKEANAMGKVGFCFNCKKTFPKERMLLCSGCRYVKYCSAKCQLVDWPSHKSYCKSICNYKDTSTCVKA